MDFRRPVSSKKISLSLHMGVFLLRQRQCRSNGSRGASDEVALLAAPGHFSLSCGRVGLIMRPWRCLSLLFFCLPVKSQLLPISVAFIRLGAGLVGCYRVNLPRFKIKTKIEVSVPDILFLPKILLLNYPSLELGNGGLTIPTLV